MVNNRVEFLWDWEELQFVTAKMMSWKQTILLFISCDYAIKNVLDVLPEGVNLWIPWWRVQLSQNSCARDQSLSGYDAGVLLWKYLWLSRSDDVGHSFRASDIPPLPLANVFDATSSSESSSRTDSGPAVMWGLTRLTLFSEGDGTSLIPKTSSPK